MRSWSPSGGVTTICRSHGSTRIAPELPLKLREMLDHAQNFSEVMHGAPVLYNLILAEQARWSEGVTKNRRSFAEWAKLLSARSRDLARFPTYHHS